MLAQLAGAVEYTDWISAEEYNFRNECPGYDTKQSDGEALVNLELRGMRSTSSLPSLPGPLWPELVAAARVLSMGQIELNCNHAKLNCLKLTVFPFNCKEKTVYLC